MPPTQTLSPSSIARPLPRDDFFGHLGCFHTGFHAAGAQALAAAHDALAANPFPLSRSACILAVRYGVVGAEAIIVVAGEDDEPAGVINRPRLSGSMVA